MTTAPDQAGENGKVRQKSWGKRPIPEYLTPAEVAGLIEAAPNAKARLLIRIQWRAGLRISEALAVEPRDIQDETGNPVLRVRRGKGNVSRLVPVHPELMAALKTDLDYGGRQDRPFVSVSRQHASRWIASAVRVATDSGVLVEGRKVSSHALRHSYARHLLAHGIPLNVLSHWLGHASINTTLIYVQLLPDPAGTLQEIP